MLYKLYSATQSSSLTGVKLSSASVALLWIPWSEPGAGVTGQCLEGSVRTMKVPGCGGKKGQWALLSLRTRWPSLYRQTHFLLVFWVFVTVLATRSWHLWSTCWETGTPPSSEQELRPWEGPLSQPVHVGPCWLLSICLLFCCLARSLWGANGAPSMPRLWTEAVYHPERPLRGRNVSTCLLGQISRGLWNSHAVYLP